MKPKIYLIAFFSAIILSSCSSTTQFYYNSTASIPQFTKSTQTVMNVVLNGTGDARFYGVLTAVDNEDLEYILLVPKKRTSNFRHNELSDFEISFATHIDLEAVQDFKASLETIISRWDKLSGDDGYFYKFESTPVTDAQQVSENEILYVPNVKFYFNVTDEGSKGELIFSYKILSTAESIESSIEMDDREDIEDLKLLLENGLEHFN